jgi:S-adenosylhomocysteine hydrolase
MPEGRVLNLVNATGHPGLVRSELFTNFDHSGRAVDKESVRIR